MMFSHGGSFVTAYVPTRIVHGTQKSLFNIDPNNNNGGLESVPPGVPFEINFPPAIKFKELVKRAQGKPFQFSYLINYSICDIST